MRWSRFDQPPGVHDEDAVREAGDRCKVVAYIDRANLVVRTEVAHRLQDVGLRGDVEARRWFVEDDGLGPK
ncbi:MAG: hypothetical protein M5U27_16795 [Gaiella sp.]|nr:hypothetical protein [Gaiella sp.]